MKKQIILTAVGLVFATMTSYAGDIDAQGLWDKHCKKCHGDTGAADTKLGEKLEIGDYTKAETLADVSDEELFADTKNGVDGTKMPSFEKKLSDDEINALVAHIRAMAK